MPTVSMDKQGGGMIRWDGSDWLEGLIPQWGIGSYTPTDVKGFAQSYGIDPFRRPGYLMPGVKSTDYTNASVVDAVLKNGVVNGSSAYLVGGAKVHNIADVLITTLTDNIGSGGIWPHTITPHGHASCVVEDVISYYIGTTKYLFYSWNDNTDGDIGRYDFSTTFDDDYISTVAASGAVLNKDYPHPMVVGDDNKLYVGNGKDLAVFDGQVGANGTWNISALDLPSDYIITSYAKTKDFLVVYAYKSAGNSSSYLSEATAFFWDYVSSSYTYAFPLMGNYVNGGFNFNGTVGCFVEGQSVDMGTSKSSRLLLWDGDREFKTIETFTSAIPGHGGVVNTGDVLFWNSSGTIYQYGTPHIGFKKALNKVTLVDGSTARGMLRNFYTTKLTSSSGTTTSGGCEILSSGFYPGSCFTPMTNISFAEDQVGKIRNVKIYWYGVNGSNCNTIMVKLVTDRGRWSTTVIDKDIPTVRNTVPTSLVSQFKLLDDFGNPYPSFSSIGLDVSYNGGATPTNTPPIIEAIEVYFDSKKI